MKISIDSHKDMKSFNEVPTELAVYCEASQV